MLVNGVIINYPLHTYQTHLVLQVTHHAIIYTCFIPREILKSLCYWVKMAKLLISARSHGASATAIRSTIISIADTYRTEWVQNPLTVTGSVAVSQS